MNLNVYNTLTQKIEPLKPFHDDVFGIYCCGPTVYGPSHIGNFRTYVVQDVVLRILKSLGVKTRYVRNLTDVDDKTIRGSQQQNKSLKDFTEYWINVFHQDCQALRLLPPDVEPKATETIDAQLALIGLLVEKGYAYASKGSVYFRISAFKDYGKLSNLSQRSCQTQATNSMGKANDADEYDRESVGDFVLWKAHKTEDGVVAWESPWGLGRPGWHIECSAMSRLYIGRTIDLHTGGIDLCFPHHENEIAQSEAAYGDQFARHWLHIAHLKVEGQKMSKSLGNLYTIKDLVDRDYTPDVVRYALLTGHYRQALNFTFDLLKASQSALNKLYQKIDFFLKKAQMTVQDFEQKYCDTPQYSKMQYLDSVFEALCDDLNVPKALGQLFGCLNNEQLESWNPDVFLKEIGCILYVLGLPAEKLVLEKAIPETVSLKAQKRWLAKKEKQFQLADSLRQELEAEGWQVLDNAEGYQLIPKQG